MTSRHIQRITKSEITKPQKAHVNVARDKPLCVSIVKCRLQEGDING